MKINAALKQMLKIGIINYIFACVCMGGVGGGGGGGGGRGLM